MHIQAKNPVFSTSSPGNALLFPHDVPAFPPIPRVVSVKDASRGGSVSFVAILLFSSDSAFSYDTIVNSSHFPKKKCGVNGVFTPLFPDFCVFCFSVSSLFLFFANFHPMKS